jgi:hypothetical protein
VAPDPEMLKQLRVAGAARGVFPLAPAEPEKVLPALDKYAEAMRAVV